MYLNLQFIPNFFPFFQKVDGPHQYFEGAILIVGSTFLSIHSLVYISKQWIISELFEHCEGLTQRASQEDSTTGIGQWWARLHTGCSAEGGPFAKAVVTTQGFSCKSNHEQVMAWALTVTDSTDCIDMDYL